jgi:hypothetical protein
MKLSLKATMAAAGALWGTAILMVGLINLADPGYGVKFLQMIDSVYPWFPSTYSWRSVLIGTMDGVIDGAVAALIFVWIYNTIVSRISKTAGLR